MFLVPLSCREIRNCKWNSQFVSGIRKLEAGSANCKWNAQIVSGIRISDSAYLYSLVAESATKSMYWQNLRYSYLYSKYTEIMYVESTYILEHV